MKRDASMVLDDSLWEGGEGGGGGQTHREDPISCKIKATSIAVVFDRQGPEKQPVIKFIRSHLTIYLFYLQTKFF